MINCYLLFHDFTQEGSLNTGGRRFLQDATETSETFEESSDLNKTSVQIIVGLTGSACVLVLIFLAFYFLRAAYRKHKYLKKQRLQREKYIAFQNKKHLRRVREVIEDMHSGPHIELKSKYDEDH